MCSIQIQTIEVVSKHLCQQVVISGNHNYSDPKIQAEVELLTQRLENTSYISNSLYTESWLRTFLEYVNRNNDYLNVTIDNEVDFIHNLKEVRKFLQFCISNDSSLPVTKHRSLIKETS